jgi:arabinogalactan endo-1,4-beta-galactosidase
MAFNMFYIMKLGSIALLLDEEQQFQRERVSTERKMWVHLCLRNRKTKGEFWALFKELTDDELKFYRYFRMSMYQFNNLLKKVQIYLLKKLHFGKLFHKKMAVCLG